MGSKKGFTLIELLVVIAIIALLLSIMMPSLRLAKQSAKGVVCRSNLKQLALASVLYAEDNNGEVVPSRSFGTMIGWTGWNHFSYDEEQQLDAIKEGKLYDYCDGAKAYRCPTIPGNEGLRTYCMTNQWKNETSTGPGANIDGVDSLVIRKLSDCPTPSSRSIFFCIVGTDFDAMFTIHYIIPSWRNIPNWRHNNGTAISFADGHAERWKWKERKLTIQAAIDSYEYAKADPTRTSKMVYQLKYGPQDNNEDLHRVQKAVWGKLGYTP